MPQRFLKPGLISSRKWDGLSWVGQSFYIRVLTLVDDFGRYEADDTLLRSLAFPLREDIRTPQVQKLKRELQANHLADFYKADGKEYLQLTNWTERTRADRSKFPDPPKEQPQPNPAESCGILPPSSSSPPSPSPSPKPRCGFIRPTIDDVIAKGKLIGLPTDECEAFFDHFESNGWLVGRNPMRSLEASLRTWKRNWLKWNKQGGAKREAPWAQEKRVREQIADCDRRLSKLHVPQGPLCERERTEVLKQRAPIVEEKSQLVARLAEIRKEMP